MRRQTRFVCIHACARSVNQQPRIGALLIGAAVAFVGKACLQLHDTQLHIINAQFAPCPIVKMRQCLRDFLRALPTARADGEFTTTACDGGIVGLLNLTQVLVERTAEIRQAREF